MGSGGRKAQATVLTFSEHSHFCRSQPLPHLCHASWDCFSSGKQEQEPLCIMSRPT